MKKYKNSLTTDLVNDRLEKEGRQIMCIGEIFNKTIERENTIRAKGYNVITMWESE